VGTVNQGADADTTGAICGMLAGAYYGREALPRRWLKKWINSWWLSWSGTPTS